MAKPKRPHSPALKARLQREAYEKAMKANAAKMAGEPKQ